MYVHFKDVERMDVVGIGLSVVFLTPQMLGFNMNPNMEPVNIQRSFTLRGIVEILVFCIDADDAPPPMLSAGGILDHN